jgi:amino acid permease
MYRSRLLQRSYEEVVLHAVGRRAYRAAVACILVSTVGTLIGFFIITGDLASAPLQHWCSSTDAAGGTHVDCAWRGLTSRAAVTFLFATLVVLPLSGVRQLKSLAESSSIAVATVLMVTALVVVRGAQSLQHSLPLDDRGREDVRYGPRSISLMVGVPIVIFALGNQLQVPTVFFEAGHAGDDDQSTEGRLAPLQRRFTAVAAVTTAGCVAVYLATGLFGYLNFGDATKGDVLDNYDLGDGLADAAKLSMAVHITLAFPIALYPGRACLTLLWRTRKQAGGGGDGGGSSSTGSSEAAPLVGEPLALSVASVSAAPSRALDWAQTVAMVYSTAAAAVLFPQVQVVFGLLGATISVSVIYLFPAAMLWTHAQRLQLAAGARDAQFR